MGKKVFANGMEISGKKADNKILGAMPDVCMSPPPPPAGPLPIPYPNFTAASKTADGSKDVKIGGKPIQLKNSSSFKKSNGDEAATNSFGAGITKKKLGGPNKAAAWSMNVKVEGKNVVRTMDFTMGNT